MDNNKLTIEIITPTMTVFKGNADIVTIPGEMSEFQILQNHAPIVSALKPGIIKIKQNNEVTEFAVNGGLAEARGNNVSIIATIAENKGSIDKNIIEKELKDNKEKILTEITDAQLLLLENEIEFQKAQLKLFEK